MQSIGSASAVSSILKLVMLVFAEKKKPHVKAWFRPCDWLQYFIHEMSESLRRVMLFKLFTQRKEIERKLGELHETETLGWRGSRK